MPSYAYRCSSAPCGLAFCQRVPLERRALPALCPACGADAWRTLSVPNINASYVCSDQHEENKFALGQSATERLATMRADDKRYAAHWSGK